jgi:hypothetical protein
MKTGTPPGKHWSGFWASLLSSSDRPGLNRPQRSEADREHQIRKVALCGDLPSLVSSDPFPQKKGPTEFNRLGLFVVLNALFFFFDREELDLEDESRTRFDLRWRTALSVAN